MFRSTVDQLPASISPWALVTLAFWPKLAVAVMTALPLAVLSALTMEAASARAMAPPALRSTLSCTVRTLWAFMVKTPSRPDTGTVTSTTAPFPTSAVVACRLRLVTLRPPAASRAPPDPESTFHRAASAGVSVVVL